MKTIRCGINYPAFALMVMGPVLKFLYLKLKTLFEFETVQLVVGSPTEKNNVMTELQYFCFWDPEAQLR